MAETLAGGDRPARVLGAFPTAIYLLPVGEDDVLAVLTSDALRLPRAVVLPAPATVRGLDTYAGPARMGDGRVQLGEVVLRPARWWRPARPRAARGRLDVPPEATGAHLSPRLRAAVEDLVGAVGAAADNGARTGADDRVRVAADRLLGLGPGLTPAGDDVLAGLFVAAQLAPYAARPLDVLARHVRGRAHGRTTALSATLLRCAADGHGVPELIAFVEAVGGGGHASAAYAELARVGHTSGRDLAVGVVAAARVAQRWEAAA